MSKQDVERRKTEHFKRSTSLVVTKAAHPLMARPEVAALPVMATI